jgi:glycosyltransferase involved in cell wall biosynthesis
MKIAIVSSAHVPSQYAHSINTVKHAAAFSKLGYAVELLCVQRYKETVYLKNIDNIFSLYGIDPIPIKFFKDKSLFYFQEVPFLGKLLRGVNKLTLGLLKNFLDPEKEISYYLKNNNFDFCYGRSYRIVNYNIKNQIPTVIESHSANPFQVTEIKRFIKNRTNSYFQGITTIHDKLKANFVKMGMPEQKVLVIEDAVDLDLFDTLSNNKALHRQQLHLPQDKQIVLYCGSLKAGKGIHIILDIAAQMASNDKLLFVIVGGNSQEVTRWNNYKSTVKNNILFTGLVNGNVVPGYLKSADILIMPYDIHDKKMVMDINTTSPIKLFEYMASKRPIISTDLEVIKKVLVHDKSILLADNVQNYIQGIQKLLTDTHYADKLAQNAYSAVASYTYKSRCMQIITQLYLQVK